MAQIARVCLDIIGGDKGPEHVLAGAAQALVEDPDLALVLVGPEDQALPFAARFPGRVEAVPTTESIGMDEHPAQAVRTKRDSSIVVGCHLVKDGRARGFFSAGSTGACMAAATLIIGRAEGVVRPMLATVLPAPPRPIIFGDIGANADCKPEYLVQFALMASAYAERVMGFEVPQVGLLNIGEEDTKGSQLALEAHALLAQKLSNFYGNVEGGDIMKATCQVVVTDGFTGNITLKAMEGISRALFSELKGVIYGSTKNKIAGALLKSGLSELRHTLSADTYGGAPLLGLKGICAIGHGSSSPEAIANGIHVTATAIRSDLPVHIAQAIAEIKG